VPVGATLVRHSDPDGEVGETHGKAAGVLGAIGAIARDEAAERAALDEDAPALPKASLADDPAVATLLAARNERLARSGSTRRTRALTMTSPSRRAPGARRSWWTPRTASPRCSRTSCATSVSRSRSPRGRRAGCRDRRRRRRRGGPRPGDPATTRTRASHACETSSRVG
jgi:hypothetical protein